MTAAIYINGLLQHEYGVDLRKIHWVQGAMNTGGAHGSPTVLPLLKPVPIEQNTLEQIDERPDRGARGRRDARHQPAGGDPHQSRISCGCFPNYVELEKEYYKRTKIYPIMHLVAIRKQVYEKYPFVATSLYNAFCESKKIALEKMFNLRALRYMTPFLMRDIDEIYEFFDGDPWPYGVEPNRPTLEAFVHLSHRPVVDRRTGSGGRSLRSDRTEPCEPSAVLRIKNTLKPGPLNHEQSRHRHQGSRHRQPHPRASEEVVDAYGHVSIRNPDNPEALLPVALGRRPNWSSATTSSNSASTASRCATRSARSISSASSMPPSTKRGPDIHSVVHAHAEDILPFGIAQATPLRPVIHSGSFIGANVPVWDIADKFGDTNLLVTNMDAGPRSREMPRPATTSR